MTSVTANTYEAMVAWAKAFAKAQSEFPTIGKGKQAEIPTKTGGSYKYAYADLPSILDAVNPVLWANGLSVSQSVSGDERSVSVETRIYHADGCCEVFGPLVLPSGGDARAAGSAITYARRYALCAALGIAPDEDDDGAQASQVREPQALSPWVWVWNESALFKAWTEDDRKEAARVAMAQLAFTEEPKNMDEARAILEHIRGQYETRGLQSDALPLEDK